MARTAPSPPGAKAKARGPASRCRAYVRWLEELTRERTEGGDYGDLMICEKLIADLRHWEREEEAFARLGAVQPLVRQCVAGARAFLRAVAAGEVQLNPPMRDHLLELARDIFEIVAREPKPRRGG